MLPTPAPGRVAGLAYACPCFTLAREAGSLARIVTGGTVAFRKAFGAVLTSALVALVGACGGGESEGGSSTTRLTSGDFAFEVEFLGAEPTNGEVRRAGEVQSAPAGTSWWAFELRVKNVSDSSMRSANAPDVGIACGDEAAAEAETVNDPGFIMGSAPFASGMLDNGAANTAVVPLAVPDDATDCRFVVRMDPLHDPDAPEVAEFPFQTPR